MNSTHHIKRVVDLINMHDINSVSLKFLDFWGRVKQIDIPIANVAIGNLQNIQVGSNIFYPYYSMAFLDPFRASATLSIFADNLSDPFNIRRTLEKIVSTSEIADQIQVNIELEFCIFNQSNDVHHYNCNQNNTKHQFAENILKIDGYNDTNYASNSVDIDEAVNIRAEISAILEQQLGIKIEYHIQGKHLNQSVIRFAAVDILSLVNNFPIIKYVIRNVGAQYRKLITFMPYPVKNVINNTILGLHFLEGKRNVYSCIDALQQNINGLLVFTNPSVNGFRRLHYIKERLVISNKTVWFNAIDSNINLDFLVIVLLIILNNNKIILPAINSTSFLDNFEFMAKNMSSYSKCLTYISDEIFKLYIETKVSDYLSINQYPHPAELTLYYNS